MNNQRPTLLGFTAAEERGSPDCLALIASQNNLAEITYRIAAYKSYDLLSAQIFKYLDFKHLAARCQS